MIVAVDALKRVTSQSGGDSDLSAKDHDEDECSWGSVRDSPRVHGGT
jgi:hypothetical protein